MVIQDIIAIFLWPSSGPHNQLLLGPHTAMNSVNGPRSDRNSLRYVGQAKADHVGQSRAREKLLCERMIVYE